MGIRDLFGSPAEPSAAAPEEKKVGFGDYLRLLREESGLAQEYVERKLGLGSGGLIAVEHGRRKAPIEWLHPLAQLYAQEFTEVFDRWDDADSITVAQAREHLRRALKTGSTCMTCGRVAQESRRAFSAPMAHFVAWLSEQSPVPADPRPWFKETYQRGGDYAKVVHWQLATRLPGRDPFWSPTERGREFAAGRVKIHGIAVLWRNAVTRFEGDHVSIAEVIARAAAEDARPERKTEKDPR